MAAKRIAVTGGYGFIGSALAIRLILSETEHQVLNVDKLTYAANLDAIPQAEGNSRYRFMQADITDTRAMRKAFEEFEPDAVMHLAAESHVDRSIDGPFRNLSRRTSTGPSRCCRRRCAYWRGLSC